MVLFPNSQQNKFAPSQICEYLTSVIVTVDSRDLIVMDIEFHIHSELTEGLLDQVPLSAPKFNRRLRQVHTLLKKSLRLKGSLTPPISTKRCSPHSREFLAGSTYNVSSIDALLERLTVQAQKSVDWLPRAAEVMLTSSGYVDRFKKWVLHSTVDELNFEIINSEAEEHLKDIHTDWKYFKQTAFDHRAAEHVPSQPINVRQKPMRTGEMHMSGLMAAYSQVIERLFNSRLSGESKTVNLFQEFKSIEANRRDLDSDNFELLWALLETQVSQIRVNSEETVALDLVHNTCLFFEKTFAMKLRETGYQQVARGDMLAYVRLYARSALQDLQISKVHLDPNEMEYDTGGDAVWSVLYYLLRAGLTTEAQVYCNNLPTLAAFGEFLQRYFQEGWLGLQDTRILMNELYQGERSDVYRRAVFSIICRHNLELEELQNASLEDYLWLKLKLVQIGPDSEFQTFEHEIRNYRYLSLPELQDHIKDSSQTQLQSMPLLFSMALVSTLCYGEAIKYLHSLPELEVPAVHLAISLFEHDLLPEIRDLPTAFELIDGLTHVNLSELLTRYIKKFQIARPNEALMYLALMPSDKAKVTTAAAVVIEADKYEIVLNSEAYILSTRWRQLVGQNVYDDVVFQIANYARASLVPEAVLMYDLIERYEDVLDVWVKILKFRCKESLDRWTEMYSSGRRLEETKAQIDISSLIARQFTVQFNKLQSRRVSEAYPSKWQSFMLLETFRSFYEAAVARSFLSARTILSNAQVLPLGGGKKTINLAGLETDVKEELPDLTATAIQVLDSMIRGQSNRIRVTEVQDDIKGLVTFFSDLESSVGDCKVAVNRQRALGSFIRDIRKQLVLTQG